MCTSTSKNSEMCIKITILAYRSIRTVEHISNFNPPEFVGENLYYTTWRLQG